MEIKDRVYALMLEGESLNYMSVQYASCLEDAFLLAKLEFEKDNPEASGMDNPLIAAKIGLFTVKTINELLTTQNNFKEKSIKEIKKIAVKMPKEEKKFKKVAKSIKKKITKKEDKNKLMQEIIKKKDIKVLEKSKDLLTPNEYKYVKEQIK